jgi:hypothetical protein
MRFIRVEMYYTYAYLREDKTPYYIGKGKGNRVHRNDGKPCNKPKDKSRILILKQNLTEEEAYKHEIYMISVLGRKDLGTGILRNLSNGGEGRSGWKMSEEHKNAIKKSNTNREVSEETRNKISQIHRGKVYGTETRNKISEASKGKKHTDETKNKISEATKGENNPNYGKKTSEEAKEKMRQKLCGRKIPKDIIDKAVKARTKYHTEEERKEATRMRKRKYRERKKDNT